MLILILVTKDAFNYSTAIVAALGVSFADKETSEFFTQVAQRVIKYRAESGDVRDDLLQLMLETRKIKPKTDGTKTFTKELCFKDNSMKQENVMLSDDYIIAQSILFILAGFDSTQSLLLFAIYELAICPHVQEKLANEVRRARSNFDGKFTYENINELKYLDKVVNGKRFYFHMDITYFIYYSLSD